MTAARITVTIPEQLARDVRQAVDDGKAESVSAYVAEALSHYRRSVTLRELLDEWWAADPEGPPSDAERAAVYGHLGLSR